jgi:hypothetical protein
VPPSTRIRPLLPLALGGALAALAALAMPAPPARAAIADGLSIGNPQLQYVFVTTIQDAEDIVEKLPPQTGGVLDVVSDPEPLPADEPEMQAFASEGATTFFVAAAAPQEFPNPMAEATTGYAATIHIDQSFMKLEEDATLVYELTAAHFIGLDPSPANDDRGPEGRLSILMEMYEDPANPHWWLITERALIGLGHAWDFYTAGGSTDELPFSVTAGSLDQSYVELSLAAPFYADVDLSDVDVGDVFTLRYTMSAETDDTWQLDTGVNVFGRDPMEPGSGSAFHYTGLMPTDHPILVPEPSGAAQLLCGAAVLLAAAGARGGRCASRC